MSTLIIEGFPLGYRLLWRNTDPIPAGFIIRGTANRIYEHEYFESPRKELEDLIVIEQVDNLTWIEHLAKERHLV